MVEACKYHRPKRNGPSVCGVTELLAGGQLDPDVRRVADHPWSTVREVAAVGLQDRFQNQKEFLGQHDRTPLFDLDL
jgi:hypothetical protein